MLRMRYSGKKQGHWVLVTALLLTEPIRTPLPPTKLDWTTFNPLRIPPILRLDESSKLLFVHVGNGVAQLSSLRKEGSWVFICPKILVPRLWAANAAGARFS